MKTIITLAAIALCSAAIAQQTATVEGDNLGKIDQQNIGDSLVQDVRTNSTSTQLGNSANANGASINVPTNVDTRDQNTVAVNPTTTSAGGAATGNRADNANQSSAATGASSSGGNTLAGQNTSTNTNAGGIASAGGGAGGQGGTSSAQGGTSGATAMGGTSGATAMGGTSGATAMGGTSGATAMGGTSGATAMGGAGAAGNSAVQVDASDRSTANYSSRATAWAPIIPGPAAAPLAAGRLVQGSEECGPRASTYFVDVNGVRFQLLGGQQQVPQGYAQVLTVAASPYIYHETELPNGKLASVFGSRVTSYMATLGTSSAGAFVVGGFGKQGDGGQIGTNTGGSLEQMVQRYTIRECVISQVFIPNVQPAPVVLQQVFVPDAVPAPRQDRN